MKTKSLTALLFFVIVLFGSGCNSTTAPKKLDAKMANKLTGKSILATTYRQPQFNFYRGSRPQVAGAAGPYAPAGIYGILISALTTAVAQAIVDELTEDQVKNKDVLPNDLSRFGDILIGKLNITDPSIKNAEEIRNHLSMNHNMTIETDEDADVNFAYTDDFDDIAEQHPNIDYIVMLKTKHWGLRNTKNAHNDQYQVYFESDMKVLDMQSKKIISSGDCSSLSKIYSLTTFLNNNGEMLKNQIDSITKNCFSKYKDFTIASN